MNEPLLTLVPAVGAVVYSLLIVVIRRRAPSSGGLLQFQGMLTLLVISSIVSVAWRLTSDDLIWNDVLLRILTWSDMWVAPALLAFLATRYADSWSRPALIASWMIAAGIMLAASSGAISRAVLEPHESVTLYDQIAAYLAVISGMLAYIAAVAFLFRLYGRERDPFERNRLKYIFIATFIIISGQLTNLVSSLQQYPVDRSLAIAAAFVLFFSLIRYRLFDIDLAFKRTIVSLGSIMLVTPFYLVALSRVAHLSGTLVQPTLFVAGILLVVPAALAVHVVRDRLQIVVSRLFLGEAVDPDLAAAEFIVQARTMQGTEDLGDLMARVCQNHFEARFTTVLLHRSTTNRFETVSTHGPFASLHAATHIAPENPLLRLVAASEDPVTPLRMRGMAEQLKGAGLAEFDAIRTCLLQPITAHGEMIGLIAIGEHLYDEAYSLNDLKLLTSIGAQAGLAIEGARLFEQVQMQADTDFLTALPNHRRLKDLLVQHLAQAERAEETFTVAMVDVDNFKLLNDTHGHVAGDEGLKLIAAFLRNAVRQDDVVGRYGGDEFMLILPRTGEADAVRMMTDIAREARRVALHTDEGPSSAAPTIPMRLSWGVGAYPTAATTERMLVAAADSDLMQRRYMRRRAGRVNTNQSSVRRIAESDPRRVRIASGLLDILDAKDHYTTEHSQQVASLGLLLAEELRLSEKDREYLWLGGLLHDIGKLNVPDEVLRKPGTLSTSDWEAMKSHPIHGARLAAGLFADAKLTEIVGSHHERWDGQGYPAGLRSVDIPFLARAVSVCDAYSAMVHDRPYRKGLSPQAAITELQRGAGSYWDPEMVGAFERAMSIGGTTSQSELVR